MHGDQFVSEPTVCLNAEPIALGLDEGHDRRSLPPTRRAQDPSWGRNRYGQCQICRGGDVQRHVGGDEDRRGVLGFRRVREFVRKMGRRGRPEVLALQLPQGPEQLAVTNLGPASKLLQEGGQECVALQHIQRVRGSDHLPLLQIRELEGQGRLL